MGDDTVEDSNRVLIGCPVRERGWILPRYLQCLLELDYPKNQIEYAFVVNDSTDDTLAILQEFARHSASPVRLVLQNMASRNSSFRGAYNIGNLVVLRNTLLKMFLKTNCNHLFSLDSDILVTPDSLNELIKLQMPVVSLLVRNDHHLGELGYYNISQLQGGRYRPIRDFPRDCLIPVDCTGAGYLINRWVIEEKEVRYHPHPQGEDAGFCDDARAKGVTIWCHTGLEGIHVMLKGKQDIQKDNKQGLF